MDIRHFETAIKNRLEELGVRIHGIDVVLGHRKPRNLEEQAIDIEDDEVLEGLGAAAKNEIMLLKNALARIDNATYGICLSCGADISEERLKAVLYAPLCRMCANQSQS